MQRGGVELKELDHSSIAALVADMNRHRGRVFRFTSNLSEALSSEWKLSEAILVRNQTEELIRLIWDDADPACTYLLNDGWISGVAIGSTPASGYQMKVMIQISYSPSVDKRQQDRLNKNLRGIFS